MARQTPFQGVNPIGLGGPERPSFRVPEVGGLWWMLHNTGIVVIMRLRTPTCHVWVFRQIGMAHLMQTSEQLDHVRAWEFFSLGMILK